MIGIARVALADVPAREVEDRDVPALVAEFEAIGESVERFDAFLSRVA